MECTVEEEIIYTRKIILSAIKISFHVYKIATVLGYVAFSEDKDYMPIITTSNNVTYRSLSSYYKVLYENIKDIETYTKFPF